MLVHNHALGSDDQVTRVMACRGEFQDPIEPSQTASHLAPLNGSFISHRKQKGHTGKAWPLKNAELLYFFIMLLSRAAPWNELTGRPAGPFPTGPVGILFVR